MTDGCQQISVTAILVRLRICGAQFPKMAAADGRLKWRRL